MPSEVQKILEAWDKPPGETPAETHRATPEQWQTQFGTYAPPDGRQSATATEIMRRGEEAQRNVRMLAYNGMDLRPRVFRPSRMPPMQTPAQLAALAAELEAPPDPVRSIDHLRENEQKRKRKRRKK